MLQTLITHAIGVLLGLGGGWYLKGRFGAVATTVAADIKKA